MARKQVLLFFALLELLVSVSHIRGQRRETVRLGRNETNSTAFSSGRVQVEVYCNNGQWGTVCRNSTDESFDANIVCRQLGYSRAAEVDNLNVRGSSSQPIWFDHISCSDFPCLQSCQNCPASQTRTNCEHRDDIAVECAAAQSIRTTMSTCNFSSQCKLACRWTDTTVPPAGTQFTLYIRFSTILERIIPTREEALMNIENVVLERVNVSSIVCDEVPQDPYYEDMGWNRVECIVNGSADFMNTSQSIRNFQNQIFAVLKSFSIPSSEFASQSGFCSFDITTDSERGTFHWNETEAGNTAQTSCTYGPSEVMVERFCTSREMWNDPDVSQCSTIVSMSFSLLDVTLQQLSADDVGEVIETLTDTVLSADETEDQTNDNLRVIDDVVTRAAQTIADSYESISLDVVNVVTINILTIIDQIQMWARNVAQPWGNQIVRAFEIIAERLIQYSDFLGLSVVRGNVALRGERAERNIFQGRTLVVSEEAVSQPLILTTYNDALERSLSPNDSVTLTLPREAINKIQGRNIRLAFTVNRESTLFPVREDTGAMHNSTSDGNATTFVGSYVVSVVVAGIADGTRLTAPLQFSLRLFNISQMNGGNGSWNASGCTLISYDETNNVVVCRCDHLTNFACLVNIAARIGDGEALPESYELTLQITTYVGVSLSLLGLILVFITHLAFKKLRQKDVSKFHVQLALAMTLMLVVFLAGFNQTNNEAGCVTVGVLLHYLILVSWMWMAAEAVLMFQKLVIIFSQVGLKYIIILSITCWAVPAIPVAISVSIGRDFYVTVANNGTGAPGFCFISNPGAFFGAFLGPIFFFIIFNTVLFIPALYQIMKHAFERHDRLNSENTSKLQLSPKEACRLIVVLFGFTFLLGLTWILSMFTFIRVGTNVHAAFALQFVFVLFNSFQGFVVFICFVVFSLDARTEWLNVVNLCCNKALPSKISRYLTTSTLATKSSAPKSLKHERDQSLSVLYVNQDAVSTISQDARNESPNLMESSVDEWDSRSKKTLEKTLVVTTGDQTDGPNGRS